MEGGVPNKRWMAKRGWTPYLANILLDLAPILSKTWHRFFLKLTFVLRYLWSWPNARGALAVQSV